MKQAGNLMRFFDCNSLRAGFAGYSLARRLRAVSLRSLRMTVLFGDCYFPVFMVNY